MNIVIKTAKQKSETSIVYEFDVILLSLWVSAFSSLTLASYNELIGIDQSEFNEANQISIVSMN